MKVPKPRPLRERVRYCSGVAGHCQQLYLSFIVGMNKYHTHWGLEVQSNKVKRPEIIVQHALPKEPGCNGLAIMHRALAGIFAHDPVDHDSFFSELAY